MYQRDNQVSINYKPAGAHAGKTNVGRNSFVRLVLYHIKLHRVVIIIAYSLFVLEHILGLNVSTPHNHY